MRLKLPMTIMLAGLAVSPSPLWAAAQSAAVDLQPFVVREVSPQVHVLITPDDYFGPAIGNIVIIEQADGLVLLDSGASIGHGRKAVAYIRSITSKPVKAVAVSHWHNDHPQGIAALKEAWPHLRVITTPQTKAGMIGPELRNNISTKPDPEVDKKELGLIQDAKAGYQKLLDQPDTPEDRKVRIRKALIQFDQYYQDFRGSYLILPTETFKSRLVIPDRLVPVEVRYFGRANTQGDTLLWLPKQKIVASGDIVVSPIPFGFNSYPADWLATLHRLKALGFKTLIPGHGEPMNDASYVDKLIASITNIRDKVGSAVRAGMSYKEVTEKVDLSSEADRFGTTPRLKGLVPVLWTDPMAKNAYKEARGIAIHQNASPEPDPK